VSKRSRKLSNPFSTGGGGGHFEANVQASFVLLMLTGGYAPCLPNWPIQKIKLQGKFSGYDTDDLIIFTEKPDSGQKRKILAQIKHSINITENDKVFEEVIQAAWNDFNNNDLFSKGKDIIALITGPLSATNINDARTILEWTRYAENVDEFFQKVELANFSSQAKRNKLQAFRANLTKANNNNPVSDETLFDFLRHFHLLGYDLDIKAGVTLSLLHSLIGQYSQTNVQSLWTQLVDEVQSANKNAGTITPESLSEDLINAFRRPAVAQIPKELIAPPPESAATNWNQHEHATVLALANLVGAWNEKNEADITVLTEILGEEYSSWITKAREILHLPGSPLSHRNGVWKIKERMDLWNILGPRIFDQNLESFKSAVVKVLSERDPSFDLPVEERYAASIYGKVLARSPALRKGLAEGLAILGSKPEVLINCSQGKAEETAILVTREIFADADWILWGSLNDLLPVLAEAAPDEFLNAVEAALRLSPCPFDELFSQEGNGITGANYLTGLLWALEGLAWDEKYLVRVCVVLGDLASHDPGGNWANRPDNSLVTILLPWFPQTIAPIEKRKVAVQTLCKEWPEIAWKLVISLLPNQHQISTGSHKPSWRNLIPDDWEKGVTNQEYWDQVSFYAELAVSMANFDPAKLAELIDHFDNLPKPSFDKLLDVLSSETISSFPEDQRLLLWDRLRQFTAKHRRFFDAEWALNDELISAIEAVADKLAPSNSFNLYQHLFSDRDFDLYEENGNWEEQRKKLEERRQNAIEEILRAEGIEAVIRFAEAVESPGQVGHSLGCIADIAIDSILLPEYLGDDNRKLLTFIGSYIWSRHYTKGWRWVDELDKSDWSVYHLGQFLSFLPFSKETWDRVAQWLNDAGGEYWSRTNANPYQTEGKLDMAIDKLIEYGRPRAAINCLARMRHAKQPIDVTQCIRALLAALSSTEPTYTMDSYHIVELIKFLQASSEVSQDELFRVEWAYLPLLNRHQGAAPKLLETRLASSPEFFCEVIRLIYRSKKADVIETEPSDDLKAIATNAWRLLHKWQTPPGTQDDGKFDGAQFTLWLQRVKKICTESGHLEVALIKVGEVLIYCPSDPDGLWINRTVAEALNDCDAEHMRVGFRTGMFNSRGVHWVDPTGKPERELAEQFRQKAEDVENAGFHRFAVTLRELADSYEREAERIIAEHNKESKEDQ
jgi:hypothetical protein